jgi:DNA-binding MarR family transcriptional regulator
VAHPDRLDLGIVLGLAYATFVDELHAHLAVEGYDDLGRSYGYVFRTLAAGERSAAELAARLGITAQGAAKLVDEMASRGYVERRPHPDDRRAKLLRLSDRGQGALASARRFHAAYEARLRERLGDRRAAALRRDLEVLAGADEPAAALDRLRPT